MRQPKVDDHVRLTQDIPERWLHHGDPGIVCSRWCLPTVAYEIEFHAAGSGDTTRALVLGEQLEVEEESIFDRPPFISRAD
jgi:hypothetical protein